MPEYNRVMHVTEAIAKVANSAVVFGVPSVFLYLGRAEVVQLVEAVAGKATAIDVTVNGADGIQECTFPIWTVYAIAALLLIIFALIYYLKHKTKTMGRTIQELETRMDPSRSSSGLTQTGGTNPYDS